MKRFIEALIIAVIVMSLILPQGQKTDTVIDDNIVKNLEPNKMEVSIIAEKEILRLKADAEFVINPVFEPPAVIPRPPLDVSPM